MQIGYSCTQEVCGLCSSSNYSPTEIEAGMSGIALLTCSSLTCVDALKRKSLISRGAIRAQFQDMLAMHPLLGLCQVADLDAFARPLTPTTIMVWVSPVNIKNPPQEVPLSQLYNYVPEADTYYVYPKLSTTRFAHQCDFCYTRAVRVNRVYLGIDDPFCIDTCNGCVNKGRLEQCITMHTFTVGSKSLTTRPGSLTVGMNKGMMIIPGQIASRVHANDFVVPTHRLVDWEFSGEYMKVTCLQ